MIYICLQLLFHWNGSESLLLTWNKVCASPPDFTYLVGQVGEQVQDEVSHPLDELLQRLQRRTIQYKLLRFQVEHHLIDI